MSVVTKNVCSLEQNFFLKTETHIHLFSENCEECWARIDEQVMYRLVYSHILGIRHYEPNRFSTFPNFEKPNIGEKIGEYGRYVKVSSRDYSSIYARTQENVTNIRYSPILGHFRRIDVCAVPPLLVELLHFATNFLIFNTTFCRKMALG